MKYDFLFEDGSLLSVPEEWREVYNRSFASHDLVEFEARLRFLVGKYVAHRAMPSKFDGIGCGEEGDAIYDNPGFYFEPWDASREYSEEPPSIARVAEEVLYQSMRGGLMQKAPDDHAAEHGTKPGRVMTPEEYSRELDQKSRDEG